MGQFSDDPKKDEEIEKALERMGRKPKVELSYREKEGGFVNVKKKRGRKFKYPEGCKEHYKKFGRPKPKFKKPKPQPRTLERLGEIAETRGHPVPVEVREEIAPQVEKVGIREITPRITRPHRKVGAPGFFTEEVRKRCLEMLKKGTPKSQMARILGVATKTIFNWINKSEGFTIEVEKANKLADEMVESSLFKRAIGYEAPKEVVSFNREGEVLRADSFEHVPPDTNAAKFWLKNRHPTKWRDQIDADVSLIPRLVVQTHQGDEVLHDAKTIEDNTPKLLTGSDYRPSDETLEEGEGVDGPEEKDETLPGNEDFHPSPGFPVKDEEDATNPDDPSASQAE